MVWKKHESGPMSYHIWAPEIHYLFGKWYIYFAGGEAEDIWKIRPYVLECSGDDPLTDEWVELGKMKRAAEDEFSFEAFSLDATVFENKGEYYYVWAEKVGVGKMISNCKDGIRQSVKNGAGTFDHAGLRLGAERVLGQRGTCRDPS